MAGRWYAYLNGETPKIAEYAWDEAWGFPTRAEALASLRTDAESFLTEYTEKIEVLKRRIAAIQALETTP